jgi:hypothetical protein
VKRKPYDLWTVDRIVQHHDDGPLKLNTDGRWVSAEPLPYYSVWNRMKLAWMVLTYKANAFVWRERGE